jgi:hypothetical protein
MKRFREENHFTEDKFGKRLVKVMKDLTTRPNINNNLLRHIIITSLHDAIKTDGSVKFKDSQIEKMAYGMGHSTGTHYTYILNFRGETLDPNRNMSDFNREARRIATYIPKLHDAMNKRFSQLPLSQLPLSYVETQWTKPAVLNDDVEKLCAERIPNLLQYWISRWFPETSTEAAIATG